MGVPIGVRNLYVAILKTDDKNGATADKPVHLAKAVEISVKPNVSSTTFYADDQASESESTLADIEVEITVDQIGSKNAAMLLGLKWMKTECWFGTEMIKRHMLHLAIKDLSPVMHIRMCGS
ncbi:hypothetical protein P7H20_26115 [Paenibacillus larvae]|nr:major tail protein [Paenibacillus larvae]MDT2277630.1 hypothetical protein [Paenibacillus larvae]